jgi:hypothetical protein
LPAPARKLLELIGNNATAEVVECLRDLIGEPGVYHVETTLPPTTRVNPVPNTGGLWSALRELEGLVEDLTRRLNGVDSLIDHNTKAARKRDEALRAELGEPSA